MSTRHDNPMVSKTPPVEDKKPEDNPFSTVKDEPGEGKVEKGASPYGDEDGDLRIYGSDEVRGYMKALIYSPYGGGKTSLLATAAEHPAMSPFLFLNYEGGLLSIKGRPGVHIVDVHSIDQVERIFWNLIQKRPGWEHFKAVGIDSGTELQAMNLESLARAAYRKSLMPGKKKNRESIDDIFQEDYGKDTARLRRVFRWFRDAPFHFFLTALSKQVFKRDKKDKDAEPELISVEPAFTNKLGASVAGYLDHVWYVFKDEEEKRWLMPQERGVYKAKTRGHKFAAKLGDRVSIDTGSKDSLNLAKMYDLLLKEEGLTPPAKTPEKK